jgi:hypothetical protein
MTGEQLYTMWIEKLDEVGQLPPIALLTWAQLPEVEKMAWDAVAEAVS